MMRRRIADCMGTDSSSFAVVVYTFIYCTLLKLSWTCQ